MHAGNLRASGEVLHVWHVTCDLAADENHSVLPIVQQGRRLPLHLRAQLWAQPCSPSGRYQRMQCAQSSCIYKVKCNAQLTSWLRSAASLTEKPQHWSHLQAFESPYHTHLAALRHASFEAAADVDTAPGRGFVELFCSCCRCC